MAPLACPFFAQNATARSTTREKIQQKAALDPVKITKVKAVATCPHNIELIVVKVETDQPGLYDVGCATFRQRAHAVVSAIDDYLDDFCRGRDVHNIEDIWQTAYVSSYWRNGPVLNNALSGLDQALWDIKGKIAGMPVYQLLGGKCRFAVDTYIHGGGRTPEEAAESVIEKQEQGFRHVRIQLGGYGATHLSQAADFKQAGFGMPNDNVMNPVKYMKGGRLQTTNTNSVLVEVSRLQPISTTITVSEPAKSTNRRSG